MAMDWSKFIKKPSELTEPSLALLYSVPGSGKSYLAATVSEVPGFNKTLIIDTEGSTVGSLVGFDDDKIDIIPVTTIEGFESVLDAALNDEMPDKYDAIVIDTFDVAQGWAKTAYLEQNTANKFKAWDDIADWSKDVAVQLRDSDKFGILVLHLKRLELETGGYVDGIMLAGSAKDTLPGIPDMVLKVERDKGVTTAYCESSKKSVSKNRHGLPEKMVDPTFAEIFEIARNRNNTKKEDK